MEEKQVSVNKHGTNTAIVPHILPEDEMRKIGFTDHHPEFWYYSRRVPFGKKSKFRGMDIDFSVTIAKDGSDFSIDVLDDDFGQPYDYQAMLERNPEFELGLIVQEFVESEMDKLQSAGVLSGHVRGEYI